MAFEDMDERLPEALMDIITSWVDVDEVYDDLYSSIKKHIELHCAEGKWCPSKRKMSRENAERLVKDYDHSMYFGGHTNYERVKEKLILGLIRE